MSEQAVYVTGSELALYVLAFLDGVKSESVVFALVEQLAGRRTLLNLTM